MWDERDFELSLRSKMAHIVAEIVSGSEGAIPEQADYALADALRVLIEKEMQAF